jgi:hypothetical protein
VTSTVAPGEHPIEVETHGGNASAHLPPRGFIGDSLECRVRPYSASPGGLPPKYPALASKTPLTLYQSSGKAKQSPTTRTANIQTSLLHTHRGNRLQATTTYVRTVNIGNRRDITSTHLVRERGERKRGGMVSIDRPLYSDATPGTSRRE